MLRFVLSDISSVNEDEVIALREHVAPFFSEKVNLKRKESICSKSILCHIMKSYFGFNDFFADCDSNGKPYFVNNDIYFNISHSGNYVLVALSESMVGCDIEMIKAYTDKIAGRFFADKEKAILSVSKNRDADFVRLWTLKESILKFTAEGIGGGLSKYDFSDHINDDYFEEFGCYFHSFPYKNFHLSFCSKEKEIQQLDADIKSILTMLKN